MIFTEEKVKCSKCDKWFSSSYFDEHLQKHFDPKSRYCNEWYKAYIILDRGIRVCKICDEEFHLDRTEYQKIIYEEHLRKHNINKKEEENLC